MNQKNNLEKATTDGATEVNHFSNIVFTGEASKLSPKSKGKIFFEVALHAEEGLYIHLSGQTESGLFSKEWIKLSDVLSLIESHKDKEFKSTAFRPLFNGGSSNNVSFFASSMRSLGLIVRSDSSIFVHKMSDKYEEKKAELLTLAEKPSRKKK